MALTHGPSAIIDGLVLYYDENNPRSGSSSELRLNRTAVAASASQRNFSQDSLLATTYASVAQYNNTAPSPGTGFSGSVWVRRTSTTTGTWDPILLIDNGGPRYRQLWFGWFTNQTSQIHCSIPYYSAVDTAVYWSVDPTWAQAGLTITIGQYYNVAFSYNNSTRLLSTYINGIFAASGTRPGLGDLNNPNNASVSIYGANDTPQSNSQTKAVALYNRSLSAAEILQNFNALKSRYNL